MRCIKCLLNFSGKKIYLLCSVVLSCLLCLSGVLSTSVSAANTFKNSIAVGALNSSGNEMRRLSLDSSSQLYTVGTDVYGLRFYFPAIYCGNNFQFIIGFSTYLTQGSLSGFVGRGNNIVDDVFSYTDIVSSYNDTYHNFILTGHYSDCPNGGAATDHVDIMFSRNTTGSTSPFFLTQAVFQESDTGDISRLNIIISKLNELISKSSQSAVVDAINNQTQQDQEHWEQAQDTFDDAQDGADSDSDSSSQQATSSGTTLLAGFQSFLGALTGASPSDCVISADLGNMDLGNMDLCQLDPPPAFQAISSIMVIGFTVPLSLALGRKMIALFRSFQT